MRTLFPDAHPTRRRSTILASMALALGLLASSSACTAMGLRVESSSTGCGAALAAPAAPQTAAQHRLPDSQAVQGRNDVAWAWLGSPTSRYPHTVLGALEQRLAAIVELPGHRPTIIVPDMQLRALHALRWEAPEQWKELAELRPMAARIERLTPAPAGACALLADGSWWRVSILP